MDPGLDFDNRHILARWLAASVHRFVIVSLYKDDVLVFLLLSDWAVGKTLIVALLLLLRGVSAAT